jgi:hypothetical protein
MIQALREIHKTTSNTVILKIPEALRHQTVEIIILPLNDKLEKSTHKKPSGWPPDFFEKFVGCLPDFPDIEPEGEYENRKALL